MGDIDLYLHYQKEVAESKLRIIRQMRKGDKVKPNKRTSQVRLVWDVLDAAGRPLHVSEIIDIARREFHVELERDSIVSGIIKKANTGKMFIRTAPNTFASKPKASE